MSHEDTERLRLDSLVYDAVEKLGEHFDAVQIMVCWQRDGCTKSMYRGGGLWHARQGMAHEFINQDVAQENADKLKDVINPPELQ